MNLYKAFKVSSTLMIATGLIAIAWAEGSFFYIAIAFTGIALGWLYDRDPIISRSASTAAGLLSIGFAPLDYLLVTQDVIFTGGHILILLQVIKLLSEKKNRDYLQMFLLSLVQLAVAAVLTIEMDFTIPFVLYLVFSTWTLILFHLKREFEKSLRISGEAGLPDEVKVEKTRGVIGPSFFAGSTSICVITLILTSIFFVIMPRISAGFLWHAQVRPIRISGFSESVDLGISGEIQLGEKEVMRVQLLNVSGPAQDLAYWRGVGLSHYDGEKWRIHSPEEIEIVTLADLTALRRSFKTCSMIIRGGNRVFDIVRYRKDPENTLIQRIVQSPLDTEVLFGMHPIYRVEFFSREAPTAINIDPFGAVYNQASQYGFVGYIVYSKILDPNSPELNSADTYPVVGEIDYAQLPAPGRGFRYYDLKNLAEKITLEAKAESPYEKVRAIERYLNTKFSYTRNIQRTPDTEPVYDFLFNQKKGHCELFASSMAVLLRTLGIPARLANGYMAGQWNPIGEFYTVRQKHAHCWVEVFFDRDNNPFNRNEIGWVRFDPTPPGMLDSGWFFSSVTDFFSYMRFKWIDYVISYSASEQRKVFTKVRSKGRQMRGWFSDVFNSIKKFFSEPSEDTKKKITRVFLIGLPPIALVLALLVFLRGRRRKRVRKPRKPIKPGEISISFYRDFLKALERIGLRRMYSQTPTEFVHVVESTASIIAQPARLITEKFLETRFGGKEIRPQEIETIKAANEEVKTKIRSIRAQRHSKKRS
jgi:transglutaminase-like putative cysteine protease